MATIAATVVSGFGSQSVTETTLTAADTFTYDASKKPVLLLRNPTAGALSPTIDGDGGATVDVSGIGPVDVSAGFAVGSIAVGAHKFIVLKSIEGYLKGTIGVTGGTGLVASLLHF